MPYPAARPFNLNLIIEGDEMEELDNCNAIIDRLNGAMPKSFPHWDQRKVLAFKKVVAMAKKAVGDVPHRRSDSSIKGELYALESFWI